MRLQFRDVTVVEDEGSGQTILEIEVRGQRGVGYCKSTAGAVRPFERREDTHTTREWTGKVGQLYRVHGQWGVARAGSYRSSIFEMATRFIQRNS